MEVNAQSRPGSSFGRLFLREQHGCQQAGGPTRGHHGGHPCESRHTQTAMASVTASCKLQLAAGLRAFSKDIYLPGRQIRFMFWVFFFLREEIPPSLTKNKHLCYATSWRPDWGVGSGCLPYPFCPSTAAQTPSHDPVDPSCILWHPAWAQEHPTQQKGLGCAGETPCYKHRGTVGTKLLVLIQRKCRPERIRNVP